MAEAGGKIKTLKNVYEDKTLELPDLTPKKMLLTVENARNMIGINSSGDEIITMLGRVRLDAEAVNEDEIAVYIPPYRIDVLHEVDIIENVAIGYDFGKLNPDYLMFRLLPLKISKKFENRIREIMIGMGLLR